MAERISKEQAEALIRQTAREAGADDLADILVAIAIAETGLDIYKPGDNGHSWGPFHENDGGRGAGLSVEERQNVPNATRRAIAEIRQKQKEFPGVSPGRLAVEAQRPAQENRPGYIKRVDELVQGAQYARGGTNAPNAPTATATRTAGGTGPVWPVPGGTISNPYGGTQYRAAGMKGVLPDSNVGVDVSAKEGTPVLSPVDGKIVKVYQSPGGRNVDENSGWGGMVLVQGSDGYYHRLSHLQGNSVSVKAGQQVSAGTRVGSVGSTGNTQNKEGGPASILDWEKFKATNPDDPNARQFTDPSVGQYRRISAVAEGAQTQPERLKLTPEELETKVGADADVKAKDAQKAKVQTQVDGYTKRIETATTKRDELIKKYGPEGPDKNNMDHAERPRGGGAKYPGWNTIPGAHEENPEFAPDKKAWDDADGEIAALNRADRGEGKAYADAKKNLEDAESNLIKAQQDARDRITKAEKDAADTQKPTYQIDSESGTVLENGVPVRQLPRDVKPGTTFNVPGKGTFIVNADGTSATRLVEASNSELYKWEDGGDRLVEIGPNGPTGKTISKGELGAKPTVLGGSDGPKLTIWNPFTKAIETIDNEGYKPPKPEVVSAPKDVRHIVQADKDGKLTVTDNPNYDPNTGSTNQVTGSGRVAHIDATGKVTSITDTLTPDERAMYDRGKKADVGKSEADAVKTLVDAAKSLHDQEMERRTKELWETAQKIAADPNASREDVIAAIQAGAKDATEWSTVFQTHINQKTQEEVARKNKVDESIRIQGEDRQTREGLYKDITDTRNQRTLAQAQSNAAIKDSGIIGEANSMNVLSAMAPQVGMDGITRAGTIGLGVGAGAIDPVKDTYQTHLDEIEALRSQMPSVRLANPDAGGKPDFSIPRPKAGNPVTAVANKPNQSTQLGTALLDKAKGIMENNPIITGVSGTPDVAGGQKVNSGVAMGGSGVSVATGKSVDEMAEEERKKREGGGGGGDYRPRFRVPKAKARKVAA